MGVRFILGRAGTGKTAWCFERIAASLRADPLGPPIFLVVPKQATFQAERRLCCGSGLDGYVRTRVMSFEDLGEHALAECGGTASIEVTAAGRQMILGHLLRAHQPQLRFFGAVARQPGLAAEIDATFAELERAGTVPSELPQLLGDVDPAAAPSRDEAAASAALSAKAHDLGLLYAAYQAFLGDERLDPARRTQKALAALKGCTSLSDAEIYVDGFHDFTDHQRRVLAALGEICRSVNVTFTLDPDAIRLNDDADAIGEMNVFHRASSQYAALLARLDEAAVPTLPPVELRDARRFAGSPALARIERWDDESANPADAGDAVTLVEAADRRAEVDVAARLIRDWLAGGPDRRLRDVAVLMRRADDYHDLIDAGFREHDLPYFVDRRRTAAHHPLLQFVRSAFTAAANLCPHEAMMTMLKSGLIALSDDEVDELENYVLLHGVRHGAWLAPEPWTGHRTARGEDGAPLAPPAEPRRADRARRVLTAPLAKFVVAAGADPTPPLREFAIALYRLLDAIDARATLERWSAAAANQSRFEQGGEHLQVWAELCKLFEQLVDLLGDTHVSLDDFRAILDNGLEGFDLALTPPTIDQVLVGSIDRTRVPAVKAVVVLGLNEGEFPRTAREGTVFSDLDRRALRQRRVGVEADADRQRLDEEFLGYLAFTRASAKLWLVRSVVDDAGKVCAPSAFWRRAMLMFDGLPIESAPAPMPRLPVLLSTPRQLASRLMRWVRSTPAPLAAAVAAGQPWPALYNWLASHPCCDDFGGAAVATMRGRRVRAALRYHNDATLKPELAQRLFAPPVRLTIPQLESHRSCPFQHFARHVLRLRPREEREVTARDLSHVYHDVLGKLLRELLAEGRKWADLTDEQLAEHLRRWIDRIGKALRGELMLSSARNKYLLGRIEKTLASVVAAQREAGARGQFAPRWADLRFGEGGDLPPLSVRTPRGQEVSVEGKIDRVDALPDGGPCVVIDYRLGGNTLVLPEVFHGLALQLLTYLLVLRDGGEQLARSSLTPAAAFYVQMLRGYSPNHPDDALSPDDPRFHLVVKPRGIFDASLAQSLDRDAVAGWSPVIQAYLGKDGTFGYRDRSDVAEPAELAGLLRHVEQRISEIAGRILAGEIDVRPYMLGKTTPCPRCEFRDVCRFDPSQDRYVRLQLLARSQVLQMVSTGATADA